MKPTLSAIENGPLVVKSDDNHKLFFKEDEQITAGNPAYLCRCGKSQKKPFCDGAHQSVNFQDKVEIKEEVIQEYAGKELSITFNRSICAGAAHCVAALPKVFSSEGSTDWIHPDQGDKKDIIQTIQNCPSGALSFSIDGETTIDEKNGGKITIVKDGPYNVEGVDFERQPQVTNLCHSKYTLCRCGHSKNKPYCDYSHAEKGWKDED